MTEYMTAGCEFALKGVEAKMGGPFGATVVKDGKVVVAVHNTVLFSKDPSCHAEMNAIRAACKILGTEDLSDCILYTTCEPCPMCWGGCQRAKFSEIHVGVDREIAAKYGFDDRLFYEELERSHENRYVRFTPNVCHDEVLSTLKNFWQVKRTMTGAHGAFAKTLAALDIEVISPANPPAKPEDIFFPTNPTEYSLEQKQSFIRQALELAVATQAAGKGKGAEVYAAVIVKDGKVIAQGVDEVFESKCATASATIRAIQAATKVLDTYNLEGCSLFTTVEPEVMGATACYWARIDEVCFAVSLQEAAKELGYVDQYLTYGELHKSVPETRVMRTLNGVQVSECEDVFKHWQTVNNIVY